MRADMVTIEANEETGKNSGRIVITKIYQVSLNIVLEIYDESITVIEI